MIRKLISFSICLIFGLCAAFVAVKAETNSISARAKPMLSVSQPIAAQTVETTIMKAAITCDGSPTTTTIIKNNEKARNGTTIGGEPEIVPRN